MNPYMDSSSFRQEANTMSDADIEGFYDLQTVGKKQNFLCKLPDCGKIFRYKSEIARHIATHSNHRPHTCQFEGCQKSFKRADALENHVRTHTKETPFACSFQGCDEKFTTKASLRYHTLKHKNQKIYKCSFAECNKSFITVFQLKQHEKSTCIHKKLKGGNKEDDTDNGTEDLEPHNNNMPAPMPVKESGIKLPTQMLVDPYYRQQQPVQMQSYSDPQGQFGQNVRNILTENEVLKKRLELSQKIINLLQQNNESNVHKERNTDTMSLPMPDAPQLFFRPSMFQGQIFE